MKAKIINSTITKNQEGLITKENVLIAWVSKTGHMDGKLKIKTNNDMTDKEINKSDNYSYHEALHMSFVFGDTIERHLLSQKSNR